MTTTDTANDAPDMPSSLQQDYQHFLLMGNQRAPHTLQVHERGYRSGTINTDALGFRYSHFAGKRFSAAERGPAGRVNLLVGGSAVLGIGASSDEHTVASHLSMLTGEVWLNLASCGLNASQELLLFLTHQHRFGQIGHVVVLSGLNTLAHEGLSEVLDGLLDPQHAKAQQAFLDSFKEGVQPPASPTNQSLWRRLGQALAPRRPSTPINWTLSSPEKRMARAADTIGRTLRQWERMLADSHATLTFILQPLLLWCRDTVPAGEQAMLAALERRPANFDKLLEDAFDSQLHMAYFRRIKRQADPVPCYDMNSMLSSSPVFAAELFVDRLHLNDLGNNAVAKVITAKLGLAQEKHAPRKVTPIKLV
ncbi:hypothetical protein VXM67_16165 [Pseudomonas sp. Rh2]|uniref:hypothetical protein n=1 Tax=Pseudomonas sp. Rh2 TaxID=3112956 RepID=UPI00345DACAE